MPVVKKFQVGLEFEPGPHLVTIETNRLDIAACDAYGGTHLVVRDVFGVQMSAETPIKCRVVHAHEIAEAEPVEQKTGALEPHAFTVYYRWPWREELHYGHKYLEAESADLAKQQVEETEEIYEDDSRVSIEVVDVREEEPDDDYFKRIAAEG
jgi:hypothetical protein